MLRHASTGVEEDCGDGGEVGSGIVCHGGGS